MRRPPIPGAERAALEGAKRSEHVFRGMRVPIYEWGTSSRVAMFFHGWEGRGAQVAAFVEPLVKRGYRVVAFDAPAHGLAEGKRTSLPEMSDLAAEIIARTGTPEVILAHSFGAMVASHALQQRALPTKRVALISAVFSADTLTRNFRALTGVDAGVADAVIARIRRELQCGWYEISGETLVPKQTAAALVIHDEDDREVPVTEAHSYGKAWRGSRVVLTKGLGHRRTLRDEGVVKQVVDFLAGDSPTRDVASA